jgi:ribosomal-protein-alanine N-acetyltransferase
MTEITIPKLNEYNQILPIARQIRNLHCEFRADIFNSDNPLDYTLFQKWINNKEFYVIKDDGVIAGYIIIQIQYKPSTAKKHTRRCYIDTICVDKSKQNKGYGRKLMEFAIEYAKNNNCTFFYLDVYRKNESAIQFYEKIGMAHESSIYSMTLSEPTITNGTHCLTREIKTHRLLLRKFRLGDENEMFDNWASVPKVTEFLTWQSHEDIEVTHNTITRWVNDYGNPTIKQYHWGIEFHGNLIGSITVRNLDENTKSGEAGYCIGEKWWGMGIATESLNAVIDFIFAEGYNRIWATHKVNNPTSGRVMEKCGMQFEGVMRDAGKDGFGNIHDVKQYAIVASDRVV